MRRLLLALALPLVGWAAEAPVPTAAQYIHGDVVTVPSAYVCKRLSLVDQQRIADKLGHPSETLCQSIELGVLPQGGRFNMDLPINAFQRQFNIWLNLKTTSIRYGQIDFQEVLALRKLEDRFEEMVKWADAERLMRDPDWDYHNEQ